MKKALVAGTEKTLMSGYQADKKEILVHRSTNLARKPRYLYV